MDLTFSGLAARALRTRWFVRAPIPMYRNGLGCLFGTRIVMLEHVGRVSGEPRFVCLEVVERATPERIVIVSGFGTGSQWYQNLAADPRCFVSIGRIRHAAATARLMSAGESAAALERYRVKRPKEWDALRSSIEKAVGHPVEGLPMVELSLRTGALRAGAVRPGERG